MKHSFLFSSIILSFSAFAFGQEALSLKDALSKAAQSNLSLQVANKELKILEGRVLQARSVSNPEVEAKVDEIPVSGGGDTAKEFGLAQEISMGGKRSLRTQAARYELEAAQAQYQALSLEVVREVKEAYWDWSLAHEQILFAEQNLRTQQRFLARAQDRFQSGQAKLADVARTKLEVARASNDLLVAKKKAQAAQSNLNRLMGENVRRVLPEPTHLAQATFDLNEDTLIQTALNTRPERNMILLSQKGANTEYQLANRLLWTPNLKAGVVYQNNVRSDGRDSWGGSLGLAVPLLYRYRGEQLSAQGRIESLEAQAMQWEQTVTFQVHQSYTDLQLSAEQIKLWQQAVDQATEATRLAEQQYFEGEVDLLIFVQARRDLVSVTSEYLGTLKNYQVNLATLEWAVGKDLTGGEKK